MEIFLTGGTGYLGSRIAEALLARGHRLRILYRAPDRAPRAHASVLPVRGDLENPSELRDAIRGVEAVVHTAAMVRSWVPDARAMHAVNVDSARILFELAGELHVPRVLYTSSFMALGPSDGEPKTESSPSERSAFCNAYERTKYLGDQVARRAQQQGLPIVTLYPTVIFGPGPLTEGNHVGRIVRDFLTGKLPGRVGRGDAWWNYAYIDDVVEAHALALERAKPGTRYIIGGDNVTIDGFLDALEAISGVPAPSRVLSDRWLRPMAMLLEWRARLFGGEPPLTRGVLDVYQRDWAYSSEAAKRDLGYGATAFRVALSKTVAWVRAGLPEHG